MLLTCFDWLETGVFDLEVGAAVTLDVLALHWPHTGLLALLFRALLIFVLLRVKAVKTRVDTWRRGHLFHVQFNAFVCKIFIYCILNVFCFSMSYPMKMFAYMYKHKTHHNKIIDYFNSFSSVILVLQNTIGHFILKM